MLCAQLLLNVCAGGVRKATAGSVGSSNAACLSSCPRAAPGPLCGLQPLHGILTAAGPSRDAAGRYASQLVVRSTLHHLPLLCMVVLLHPGEKHLATTRSA